MFQRIPDYILNLRKQEQPRVNPSDNYGFMGFLRINTALHRCFSKHFGEAIIQITLILSPLLECL